MAKNDPAAADDPAAPPATYREVRYRHSGNFVPLLAEAGVSLLVSTYQAGKLVNIGVADGRLSLALHNFEQAMGLAVHPRRLAVGSRGVIWFLQDARELAPRLSPPGRYDACYLARQSFITGSIHGHEMAWVGDDLWVVNTLFSCLCTLDEEFSFVPRWQPPFITALEGHDRCHLNGLAIADGRPKYVTVMAETDTAAGWRAVKAQAGAVLDVSTGAAVTRGLAMPHSPRVYQDRLWVLHSGCGSLEVVDLANGRRQTVTTLPGYTRGLAFHGQFAFVGLSRIRETSVFGGVPIAERRSELKCGVAVVDLTSGQAVAYLEFESGVEEIFDVQVVPARCVALTGPYPAQDDAQDVWVVPPPGTIPQRPDVHARPESEQLLSDPDVSALLSQGLALHGQGRHTEAVEQLQRAANARPQSAEIHNHLGNAWQDCGRQDLALASYRRAAAANPRFAPAQQNLGYLLINAGSLDEGLEHLRRAQEVSPQAVNRVMLATSLPVIYDSQGDLTRRRQSLEDGVRQLVADQVTIDTTNSTIPTNFFAAYQGGSDRELAENLGQVFRGPQLVPPFDGRRRTGRIRVGMLSSHLCDHTIGRLNLGRVAQFYRKRFELFALSIGHRDDVLAESFRRDAEHHLTLTGSVESIRRQVADLALDLLFFPDVGMNALTYTLAFSRMAPVQCVGWGHPVTTGSPAMDFFLSSELLETPASDNQYTERLVRAATLGTYYYRPQIKEPLRSRSSFGLPENRHLYACPQTLFKIHPEFDAILRGILELDPAGELILIAARQQEWTRLLRDRFTRTLGEMSRRVHFLPAQPHADFLQLNALVDVLLDPIHFGGGNTSYEAFALGTPVVTLPGEFLRSRITLALYRKLGVMDCVVATPAEYVAKAVRLGTDPDHRRATSRRILDASGVLFEDAKEIRDFERFLAWAAAGGATPWQAAG